MNDKEAFVDRRRITIPPHGEYFISLSHPTMIEIKLPGPGTWIVSIKKAQTVRTGGLE